MHRIFAIAVMIVVATAVSVVPAAGSDTDATFTLTAAGGLSISAPGSADLGSAATDAGTLSTQLGAVTVTDDRGDLLGVWTASVVGTAFTTGAETANETIAATGIEYWSGLATASSGTAVIVPGQVDASLKVAIDTAQTAFSATGVVGNNSATWNPTVVVNIPSASVVGTYSGTVTHSVA